MESMTDVNIIVSSFLLIVSSNSDFSWHWGVYVQNFVVCWFCCKCCVDKGYCAYWHHICLYWKLLFWLLALHISQKNSHLLSLNVQELILTPSPLTHWLCSCSVCCKELTIQYALYVDTSNCKSISFIIIDWVTLFLMILLMICDSEGKSRQGVP